MQESSSTTDAELVHATLQGSDTAFTELIHRHKAKVFSTAARYARGEHQIQDLSQEVFLRAYRHLNKYRGDAPFSHWLAKVTSSTCLDFLRKERRKRLEIPLDSVDFELPDPRATACVDSRYAREILHIAMARLSAEEHWILTLCELEERPLREVSALSGWSEANVKVRVFRARQNLKKILHSLNES